MLRQLAVIAVVVAGPTGMPTEQLAAQSPSRPAVGQRIRVNLSDSAAHAEGRVAGWRADTLLLRQLVYKGSPDSLLYIPRVSIASYQVSLGQDFGRGASRGARTGALVGGGIGLTFLALGLVADRDCEDYCFATLIGAVLGAGTTLGGLALGATIGVLTAPERWGDAQTIASRDHRSPFRRLAFVLSIDR